jgi:F420-dependent oxidoreductase-like protein
VKFGVQIENHLGFSYNDVLKVALEAEKLGYDGLFICDHLQGRNEPTASQPCIDPWVTLGALATATKTLRLGTLVTAVGFRHPSILAKMAATLDSASNGRVQLGIGAGWYESEYSAYGVPFPPTRQRMQQLREAIQIIKMLWTQDRSSFNGKQYTLKDTRSFPKPANPRIWVGGTGEKKLLKIVADLADGWNATGTTTEDYEKKLKTLELFCTGSGRDLQDIERSYYAFGLAAKTEKEFQEQFRKHYGQFKKPDETMEAFIQRVRGSSRSFIGTIDEVIGKIEKFSKLGVTYTIFYFPDKQELGFMREFSQHILPSFKS